MKPIKEWKVIWIIVFYNIYLWFRFTNNKSINFYISPNPSNWEQRIPKQDGYWLERDEGLEAVQSIQLWCEPGHPLLPRLPNRRRRWWVPHLFLALLRLHLVTRRQRRLQLLAQEFETNRIKRTKDGIHGGLDSKRRLTELLFELMMRREVWKKGLYRRELKTRKGRNVNPLGVRIRLRTKAGSITPTACWTPSSVDHLSRWQPTPTTKNGKIPRLKLIHGHWSTFKS